MTTSEFIFLAETELGNAFPDLVIRLFPDPDDSASFFAYMFCVPDGTESNAKNHARAMIRERLKEYSDWRIIPSVKNLSVTREHYPQYLRTNPAEGLISNAVILPLLNCNLVARAANHVLIELLADACCNDHSPCDIPLPQDYHESPFKLAA